MPAVEKETADAVLEQMFGSAPCVDWTEYICKCVNSHKAAKAAVAALRMLARTDGPYITPASASEWMLAVCEAFDDAKEPPPIPEWVK